MSRDFHGTRAASGTANAHSPSTQDASKQHEAQQSQSETAHVGRTPSAGLLDSVGEGLVDLTADGLIDAVSAAEKGQDHVGLRHGYGMISNDPTTPAEVPLDTLLDEEVLGANDGSSRMKRFDTSRALAALEAQLQ